MYIKSSLRISTEALKPLLLYRTQCSDTPLFAFHHLEDSTNPRARRELLDRSCTGRWQRGREGAWQHPAQAGMATLSTAKCITMHHKHSFQQPCLTLFSSPEEQNTTPLPPPIQSEGTNLLQSPTHRQGVSSGQLCELGNSFAKEISQCLLALRAE